jgi:VWFA-related protein
MTRLIRVAALAFLSAAPLVAQPSLKLEVLSPLDGAYVSGSVTIEARLVPLAAERQVVEMSFFADGATVCTVARPPFRCVWNAGPAVRAHQLRVVAELSGGVRLVQTLRTRGVDAESAGVSAVQVTATVKDGRGRFVPGLTAADFSVFEAGVPQTISGFAAEQSDVTLALALDTSGSMEHALPAVKVQAKAFLQALPSTWPTTVLSFDNNVFVVAPPSVPAIDRARAIDGLKAWGGTALYTAVVRALAQVQTGSGRKAVVVFTDGQDRNSTIDAREVRSAIEASEAAVYFVAAGDAARSREMSEILDELAEISGGRVLRGRDTGDIERAFAEVREEIRNQYLLTYVPGQLGRPGTYRPLSVKVTCRGCRVRARAGYTVQGPRR